MARKKKQRLLFSALPPSNHNRAVALMMNDGVNMQFDSTIYYFTATQIHSLYGWWMYNHCVTSRKAHDRLFVRFVGNLLRKTATGAMVDVPGPTGSRSETEVMMESLREAEADRFRLNSWIKLNKPRSFMISTEELTPKRRKTKSMAEIDAEIEAERAAGLLDEDEDEYDEY